MSRRAAGVFLVAACLSCSSSRSPQARAADAGIDAATLVAPRRPDSLRHVTLKALGMT